MSSSNTWVGTLLQINPEYLEILKKWENGPKFSTKLTTDDASWILEVYQDCDFEYFDPLWYQDEFYSRVTWCEQQLSTWHNVKRKSHVMWEFQQKQEAEKFQTFYNLKWAH